MSNVRVIVLRTGGTNCDMETQFAFERAGAAVERVHINQIIRREKRLKDFHILALPGGFSYGDDISAGKILANELSNKIGEEMAAFVADGRLVIGICNGFQVLVKTGFLPGLPPGAGAGCACGCKCENPAGKTKSAKPASKNIARAATRGEQSATLFNNDCGSFQCRWVWLKPVQDSPCVFTRGIDAPIYLPIAHGEGKLLFDTEETRTEVRENHLAVFRYTDAKGRPGPFPVNPNGSVDDIAGLCNATGRVFGLMPHPERYVVPNQHPRWTRGEAHTPGDGFRIFKNAVTFAKKI
jgi:phosphoribosylformylglycinamidine synthase subunit PurQ / glutaminase